MIIKYRFLVISLGIITLFSSCNDELDLEPISQEVTENAYSSGGQIQAALAGCYESFQSSQYYIWDQVIFQDVRSDNHYAGGDNVEIFAFDQLNIQPTNSRVLVMWSSIYNAISKTNLVLERAPLVEEDFTDEERQEVLGQAYFLRAYHYFTLVKNFGGVPLQLEPISSLDPADLRIARSTTEEVYNQIVSDLEEALTRLPATYGDNASVNKARATSGAANALMAKVYAQRPNRDYNQVLQYCNAVIESPAGYSLMNNYDFLFDGDHYNNVESILEIQFLGGVEGNWVPQLQLPPSLTNDSWRKFITPSHDLVNAFDSESDDVRKNATILFEQVNWVDEYWGNTTGSSVPFSYKLRHPNGSQSADDIYLLRLGDILLLKAEAQNELGNSNQAAQTVNTIRSRVNLDNLSDQVSSSQAAMREAILKERRLELAAEFKRWDDLKRYNVAIETMEQVDDLNLSTGQPVDYQISETDLLLPIPQNEIDRNPRLEQNPGY